MRTGVRQKSELQAQVRAVVDLCCAKEKAATRQAWRSDWEYCCLD